MMQGHVALDGDQKTSLTEGTLSSPEQTYLHLSGPLSGAF